VRRARRNAARQPDGRTLRHQRHELRPVAHRHRRRHRRHGARRRRRARRPRLLLRRWGRRSEIQLYGSKRGDKRFFSEIDGLEYDNLFIFDEVGWNFEPSELSAAFGLVQLRKLPRFLERRRRNFTRLRDHFDRYPEHFVLPRQLDGLDTCRHMFPIVIRPESGIRRAELQQELEARGIDTRMVWTGNVLRQPAFRDVPHRADPRGCPNADRVMEHGLVLPCNHGISDEDVDYICAAVDEVLAAAAVGAGR
jgi:CDP-6-deoxy-D-xylo-4-hexulose-3-dehydrase